MAIVTTARDAAGAVLAGRLATFTVSGTSNALSAPSATTDAAGVASVTLTSTRAEQKTIRVSIDGVAVAQQATVTFSAAPAARLAFTVQPSGGTAGELFSPLVSVAVEDALGNRVTSGSESVSLSLEGGAAGASLAGGSAIPTVGGVATFGALSVDLAGAGYALSASASGVAGATSSSFAITPAAPDRAASALAVSPASLAAGGTTTLTVTVRDFYGNPVPGVPVRDRDRVRLRDAGYVHTLAVKTDGTLWAWGHNFWGPLGDGTPTDSVVPVHVGGW